MVDKADVVVAAFDGKPGGTAYTVDYAIKHDRIVIGINPSLPKSQCSLKTQFNHDRISVIFSLDDLHMDRSKAVVL